MKSSYNLSNSYYKTILSISFCYLFFLFIHKEDNVMINIKKLIINYLHFMSKYIKNIIIQIKIQ